MTRFAVSVGLSFVYLFDCPKFIWLFVTWLEKSFRMEEFDKNLNHLILSDWLGYSSEKWTLECSAFSLVSDGTLTWFQFREWSSELLQFGRSTRFVFIFCVLTSYLINAPYWLLLAPYWPMQRHTDGEQHKRRAKSTRSVRQKHKEQLLVGPPNAVPNPRAMMVATEDADITATAMISQSYK